MSEYLIQDTTLTGIADKIRPLLGLTGTMTTDQMQTNLTTEQANITAALAALAEKGVEVPEGANSNALAGLIEAIEAGGGKVYYGSLTPAENTQTCRIDCDMTTMNDGHIFYPKVAIVCDSDLKTINYSGNNNKQVCGAGIQIYTETIDVSAIYSFKGSTTASWGVYKVTEEYVSKAVNGFLFFYANEQLSASNCGYISGRTYHFIAVF